MSLIHQNWWFTTLLVKSHKFCPPLSKSLKCDVLIVGGGVSGISAAAEFVKQGKSVVLIERNIVGGGSAGRSAGFLTPDSELELHQLVRRYGPEAAREIWDALCAGSNAWSTASGISTSSAGWSNRTRSSSASARVEKKPSRPHSRRAALLRSLASRRQ